MAIERSHCKQYIGFIKKNIVFAIILLPIIVFYGFSIAAPNQVFHNPQKGFQIYCPKGVWYNETYKIGVWTVQKTGNRLFKTDQSVTIN